MTRCCESCGRPFDATPGPKGGQPRVYCDADCRRWNTVWSQFITLLPIMRERATAAIWLRIRSELWGYLNVRPWNRGVKRSEAASVRVRR